MLQCQSILLHVWDNSYVTTSLRNCPNNLVFRIVYLLQNMSDPECPIQNPASIVDSINEIIGFIPIPHPVISDSMHCGFLLPIEYLEKSYQKDIAKSVSDDLELIKLTDTGAVNPNANGPATTQKPMYEHFVEPLNDFGNMLIPEVSSRFTTNIDFLKDTQTVVLNQTSSHIDKAKTTRFIEIWKEIKEDRSFLERHAYMEYKVLEDLNKSRTFLNLYTVLNLVSPIYSLVLPLIILLLPFLILKMWNTPITFDVYLKTLREVGKQHYIGKILNIKKWNFENVMYVFVIGGMYLWQTYNQVISCIKLTTAIERMNSNLLFIREYLDDVTLSMDTFIKRNSTLPYYSDFCQDIHSNRLVLLDLRNAIGSELTPYSWSISKIAGLGHMFDCYYQLYSSIDYEASLRYSIGFVGYIDILHGISRGYQTGKLGKIEFDLGNETDASGSVIRKTRFVDQYYPANQVETCIKNTIDVEKNILITGVNASGKTTTLKTAALNIIFSQQFGFGFYKSGELTPYSHIHSYLNIPDTSGRDSLFQAESRRCKEILDKIKTTPTTENHFCIFDELYSGTNPSEAAKSAYCILKYLSRKPNVKFILTTHYVNVCRKFNKSEKVKNYKMMVDTDKDGGFVYTYKLAEGISTLEGGIEILRTMNYPAEILKSIKNQKM